MAHEIENMFSVRETPWHKLGTVLAAPPTITEGIQAAGLAWDTVLQPTYYANFEGKSTPTDMRAHLRLDTGALLGVVGKDYTPLDNKDAFAFFQPVMDAGLATLETAGCLRGGKRVFIMARLAGDPVDVVPGDTILPYALLSTSHDGSSSTRVAFCATRVVCANTLAMATAEGGPRMFARHTTNIASKMDEIRQRMDTARRSFLTQAEYSRAMAHTSMVESELCDFVRDVFAPNAKEAPERVLERVIPLFEHGRGNDLPGVKGTVWAGYNAVVEYLEWERGTSADRRMDSAWFGDGALKNTRAFDLARKLAVA